MSACSNSKKRSEKRRLTQTISLRTSAEMKSKLQQNAMKDGYHSLSGWLLHRATGDEDNIPRAHLIFFGYLGQLGAALQRLAAESHNKDTTAIRDTLIAINDSIVELQRSMISEVK